MVCATQRDALFWSISRFFNIRKKGASPCLKKKTKKLCIGATKTCKKPGVPLGCGIKTEKMVVPIKEENLEEIRRTSTQPLRSAMFSGCAEACSQSGARRTNAALQRLLRWRREFLQDLVPFHTPGGPCQTAAHERTPSQESRSVSTMCSQRTCCDL